MIRKHQFHSFWLVLPVLFNLVSPLRGRAELPALIPRNIMFANPVKTEPRLSPDGRRLSWLAPDSKMVLQIWVKTIDKQDDKPITSVTKGSIDEYWWAQNNRTILYLKDTDGDMNWHLHGVDVNSGETRDYTPQKGVQARFPAISAKVPHEILIHLNLRNKGFNDVYRLNLATGDLKLDTENPGDVIAFSADPDLGVRGALVITPDGGTELRVRSDAKSDWNSLRKVGPGENVEFVTFSPDRGSVILRSSVGTDTERIIRRMIATGEEEEIAASPKVDAGKVLIHPTKHTVQAVSFNPARRHWKIVDPSIKRDFEEIARLSDGDFDVVDRDSEDCTWLVAFKYDKRSQRYYTWNRVARKGTLLFISWPELDRLPLAEMKPVTVESRDGLTLHGYLTLPVDIPSKALPMVLFVHGGPNSRDTWGFDATVQWFANRGYACLQVNYRGSIGYGKTFQNAGNKQWGLKMQDDLIDAVNWIVRKGVVDPKKIAIFGGSYGGYAALAGVTFTPEVFACAVDLFGISDLIGGDSEDNKKKDQGAGVLNGPLLAPIFKMRIGDPSDPNDAQRLKRTSPLYHANQIIRPLFIGQGGNDPIVKPSQSQRIVSAIEKKGGRATYVFYPDEGHGFGRHENAMDINARIEAFLAENLGGRAEPMRRDRYPGSTAVVKEIGK